MAKVELNTRKVMARLKSEGWISRGGANHEVFVHPERPETMIPVPCHRELTPLTARSIAKAAGWV
jgi:predicted RNA binding protein YcfA (HicA-like mRNA interferase family)